MGSRALPTECGNTTPFATKAIADPSTSPKPFTSTGRWKIRIQLKQEAHRLAAGLAVGEIGRLNPAWIATDAMEILSRVRERPVLPHPPSGRRRQANTCLGQWFGDKFRLGSTGIDALDASVARMSIEQTVPLPAEARQTYFQLGD